VDWVIAPTNRSWTRDFLPLFLKRSARDPLATAKFRFNGWARYPNYKKDEAAGSAVAARFPGPALIPELAGTRVVLEGGAVDTDGEGTLLTTESCLLRGKHARNPQASKKELDALFREVCGTKKVVWFKRGIAGDDTAGHVDDFARFVAPGKVLLARQKNARDADYRVLESAREVLTYVKDARGRRIDVLRLDLPSPVTWNDQRLPASYLNFYIANGVVLVPTFNDPADRDALGLLAELFPERRVVGVYCRDWVLGLGTLHCSTMQEPRVELGVRLG
jgi:agmatine deiminase